MRIAYLLFAASAVFLTSLSSKPKPSAKAALKVLKGFCEFVPSGNAVVDGDTVSVQAFYMSKTEMTNLDYLEFLAHLKKNGEWGKYEIAKIDSSKWVNSMGYGEPYKEHYHKHPAYGNYPVVNISKEGAEMYCQWLSWSYDSISGGELKLTFRIPTKAEYIRAARGDNHNYQYSWSGPFLRNSDGDYLANFLAFGARNIAKDQSTGEYKIVNESTDLSYFKDYVDVLAPAKSYFPNEFGFYNLNGNASEMISDEDVVVGGDWKSPGYDIRIESKRAYNGAESTVGFRVVATYLVPEK